MGYMTYARSILIVEDEPLIAMMLEDFLDSLGHTVRGTCETVECALEEVEKGGENAIRALDDLVVQADALGYTFDRQRFEDGDEYTGRDIVMTRRSDGRELQ